MTNQQDEHFSALIDGELDDANSEIIINKLCQDKEAQARWQRYHLISDALHSKLPEAIDPNFSSSVMKAIADEPSILAPAAAATTRYKTPLVKKIASVAIAASVAVVAVLSVQTTTETETVPQLAKMPASDEFVRLARQNQSSIPTVAEFSRSAPAVSRSPVMASRFTTTPAMTVSSNLSPKQTARAPLFISNTKPVQRIDTFLHQ